MVYVKLESFHEDVSVAINSRRYKSFRVLLRIEVLNSNVGVPYLFDFILLFILVHTLNFNSIFK